MADARGTSSLKVVGSVAAGIATVVAAIVGLRDSETPDANEAKKFLEWYYATAPAHPEQTWPRLTESFKERQGTPSTESEYRDYWNNYSSVVVTDVRETDGWWSATVSFTETDGDVLRPPSHFEFDLRCRERTQFWLVPCDKEDVLINASRFGVPALPPAKDE